MRLQLDARRCLLHAARSVEPIGGAYECLCTSGAYLKDIVHNSRLSKLQAGAFQVDSIFRICFTTSHSSPLCVVLDTVYVLSMRRTPGAVLAPKFWGHYPYQPLHHRVHCLRSPKPKKIRNS